MPSSPGGWQWIFFIPYMLFMPIFLLIAAMESDGSMLNSWIWATLVCALVAAIFGFGAARKQVGFLYGRTVLLVMMALFAVPVLVAYAVGFGAGKAFTRRPGKLSRKQAKQAKNQKQADAVALDRWNALPPLDRLQTHATETTGNPWLGGVVGYDYGSQMPICASPRGATLVLGPPGSGKTVGTIITSVMSAPGSVVSTSIKTDVLSATYKVRLRSAGQNGHVWLFDPDMSEETPAGVTRARWSPIASVHDWDSALLMGKAVMESSSRAARGENGDSKGDDKHFTGRATDWLQCLLYAAHLLGAGMSAVADWASGATDKSTIDEVAGALGRAKDSGDLGAKIAWSKLSGLLQTPEKERGSIVSTMIGSLRVYDSVKAREVAENPNFNPSQFVRSTDTLYITSRPDRQAAFGPLIGALLEQIRYATYDRHKRVLAGQEPEQPHVSFILDEAANTAPVPLDRMVSEAGGQGLHLVVGLQSITQAYERWGDGGKGFLTLFPMKVVLPGTFDEDTTKALSAAAGKYDRQITTHSVGTSYVGRYMTPIASPSTSYQVQREEVLTQGDITSVPRGKALVWDGPDWGLLDTGFSFQAPYWLELSRWGEAAEIPLLELEK